MAKFKENGKLKLLIIVGTRPEIIRTHDLFKDLNSLFMAPIQPESNDQGQSIL